MSEARKHEQFYELVPLDDTGCELKLGIMQLLARKIDLDGKPIIIVRGDYDEVECAILKQRIVEEFKKHDKSIEPFVMVTAQGVNIKLFKLRKMVTEDGAQDTDTKRVNG